MVSEYFNFSFNNSKSNKEINKNVKCFLLGDIWSGFECVFDIRFYYIK